MVTEKRVTRENVAEAYENLRNHLHGKVTESIQRHAEPPEDDVEALAGDLVDQVLHGTRSEAEKYRSRWS